MGALDGAIELGSFGRQKEQLEALVGAGLFELGLELAAAVDLDACDGKRGLGDEFVEQGLPPGAKVLAADK